MGCVPSGNVIVCSPFAIGKSTGVIEHNGPCSSMLPSGHHDNGRITTTSPMTDRSHGLSPGCYAPGCVAASRRASNDVRRMRKRTARRGRYGRWPWDLVKTWCVFPRILCIHPLLFMLLRFDWSPSRNQTLFLLEIPPFTSMIFRELNLYLQAIIRPATFDYQRVCIKF